MRITITDILSAEMTRILLHYKQIAQEGEKEIASHRYLCLLTALWMVGDCKQPVIPKTEEEVREEIRRFISDINRNATVQTMYTDGRRVELLNQFLETFRPAQPAPVQTSLL